MYDVIVIGSGIGGLTAAGLLAGVGGRKVLVLEKHTEPGGLTHVFRRDGASWDVGLHYVGDLLPGSLARGLFDYLSGGQLKWNRMTDAFECFVYPERRFAVPSDPKEYELRLIEAFPDEAEAIRRYFDDVRKVMYWNLLGFSRWMAPRPIEPLIRIIQKLTSRKAVQTTEQYLSANFRSPDLRALLATQWGDYGLPPSRSAFAIHALIVDHYLHGAWFPEGGAARIARTFERGIEQAGGTVRVAQEVVRIITEGDRAVGVEVIDRRGPIPRTCIYKAPVVISNIGAPLTFEYLLPTNGEVGSKTADIRSLIERLGKGLSVVTLYLRLKSDPRELGVRGENFWINTDLNHDDINEQAQGVLKGSPRRIYVSFPSIKAGDTRFHTAEIIAFLDDSAFAAWRDRPKGNRGADYSALKKLISDGLLKLADTIIPGLASQVEYSELATPLTVEHYTSHPAGGIYGLPATPERYISTLLGPRTPISGLYLSGADAGSLGIVGAMMGGLGAACQVLGAMGMPMIWAAMKFGTKKSSASILPSEKRRAVLVKKQPLTPSIWHLEFEVEDEIGDYAPGQFARLHVGDGQWRDYSIAGIYGGRIRFLISTRTGGDGSLFVQKSLIGTSTEIEFPLGNYTLAKTNRRKIFIATGTGLAPFLPMFEQLAKDGALEDAALLFGCRTVSENITHHLEPLPSKVICCVSQEMPPEGGVVGRVTTALAELSFDPDLTEFYICGSSTMVADAKALLEARGAKHLLVESF